MEEILLKKVFFFHTYQVRLVGVTALARAQSLAILVALSFLLKRARAVMAWSIYLPFCHTIANSASICLANYCILRVNLMLSIIEFVSLRARELAGIEKLVGVVADIVMIS